METQKSCLEIMFSKVLVNACDRTFQIFELNKIESHKNSRPKPAKGVWVGRVCVWVSE